MAEQQKEKGGCCGGKKKQRPQSLRPTSAADPSLAQSGKMASLSDDTIKQSKIIVMGNTSIGKTTLIRAFMDNASQRGRRKQMTNTVQDFRKVVELTGDDNKKQQLQLNIWDAAGDQKVENLAHLFLRDVQVGILCYGIDNRASFDYVDQWYELIRNERGDDVFLVLVGTRSDLTEARAVPVNFGRQKQQNFQNCFLHIETSAYSDIESINLLFDKIAKEIVARGAYTRSKGTQL